MLEGPGNWAACQEGPPNEFTNESIKRYRNKPPTVFLIHTKCCRLQRVKKKYRNKKREKKRENTVETIDRDQSGTAEIFTLLL